jgi:gliding motility-associated lipoprotein GldD
MQHLYLFYVNKIANWRVIIFTRLNCKFAIGNWKFFRIFAKIFTDFTLKKLFLITFIFAVFIGCSEHYVPKPRAYHRIDLPEKEYQLFDDKTYPYTYEIPVYANVTPYETENEKWWANVNFPSLNAAINLSYKALNHTNLKEYIADAMMFVDKHQGKAMRIRELDLNDPKNRIYGMIFDIGGAGVASTYQFYLTDSSKHFVRGALYFDGAPNNDSLAPVIEFLKLDIDHFIETFQWRKK